MLYPNFVINDIIIIFYFITINCIKQWSLKNHNEPYKNIAIDYQPPLHKTYTSYSHLGWFMYHLKNSLNLP